MKKLAVLKRTKDTLVSSEIIKERQNGRQKNMGRKFWGKNKTQ